MTGDEQERRNAKEACDQAESTADQAGKQREQQVSRSEERRVGERV